MNCTLVLHHTTVACRYVVLPQKRFSPLSVLGYSFCKIRRNIRFSSSFTSFHCYSVLCALFFYLSHVLNVETIDSDVVTTKSDSMISFSSYICLCYVRFVINESDFVSTNQILSY
jgi:hypothetical protein